MIKANINSDNHVGSILFIGCDEDDTASVVFPKPLPQLNHEKRMSQTEGQSTKYMTSAPENYQGHVKHEKSEKLS